MRAVFVIACIGLTACSRERQAGNEVDLNAAAVQAQDDIDNYAAGRRYVAGRRSAPRRRSPAPSASAQASVQDSADTSDTAAAGVVSRYFALIAGRRFQAAWSLWRHHGTGCGRSSGEFAASLGALATLKAQVGVARDADAGAGQRYVTVPARLHATLRRGPPLDANATVTLHRVAEGIETLDPTDHQWRIAAMTIMPPDSVAQAALMPCPGGG